ncbi:MAG: MCP four helix bundle domain-containing protein, partial [Hungatella sp.]
MFKNMKIAKKLISSFIAVVIISSIASVTGLILLRTLDKGYGHALINNGFVQGDIGNYNAYLNQGAAMVRDVIMLTDEADIKSAQADLEIAKAMTLKALAATKERCQTPEELVILAKIDAAAPKYQEARDRAVALGLANKNDEALRVFREEARPYLLQCTGAGEELMALNVTMGDQVSADLSSQSSFGMILIVIVMIVSTIIAVTLALIVSRGISRPVQACADRLVKLSDGDLHTAVPDVTSTDEIGVMLGALKKTTDFLNSIIGEIGRGLGLMAQGDLTVSTHVDFLGDFAALRDSLQMILDALNHTLGQINQSSDQVSSGSDQVSSGAQALSQGATEQASSVEELAATITEISQQVKNTADNALVA